MLGAALQGCCCGLPTLPTFAATAASLLVCYRVYNATNPSSDSGVALVREKSGSKSFGLWTRLSFYFDCRGLYHDVWHKVSDSSKQEGPDKGRGFEINHHFSPKRFNPWPPNHKYHLPP